MEAARPWRSTRWPFSGLIASLWIARGDVAANGGTAPGRRRKDHTASPPGAPGSSVNDVSSGGSDPGAAWPRIGDWTAVPVLPDRSTGRRIGQPGHSRVRERGGAASRRAHSCLRGSPPPIHARGRPARHIQLIWLRLLARICRRCAPWTGPAVAPRFLSLSRGRLPPLIPAPSCPPHFACRSKCHANTATPVTSAQADRRRQDRRRRDRHDPDAGPSPASPSIEPRTSGPWLSWTATRPRAGRDLARSPA